jgi:dihydroflavonol-4-reductase
VLEPGSLLLVTGANGFIGSHLTETLLAQGYRVRCMVRRTSDLTFIRSLPVELAYGDVQDRHSLLQACQGIDAVCHCAALTRALDEATFFRVNAHGTEALAQAALQSAPGLKRFLFVSSQAAAGPSESVDDRVDESRPARPVTWYGKSKIAAEQALLGMAAALPVTIIRPSAVYGPRDRDFHAYFRLVKLGLSLQVGRGEKWLSLIYVHDLVDLLLLAIESPDAVGQVYFGCGQAHSRGELAQAIARAMHKRTLRLSLPEAILDPIALAATLQGRLTGKPALLNDQRVVDMRQRYFLCSGQKARQELGFAPQRDLEQGCRETAAWYVQHGWL